MNMESLEEVMKRQEPLDPELKRWFEKGSAPLNWNTIKHPLVFAVPYMEPMNAVYNAQLKAKKEYAAKALEEKKVEQLPLDSRTSLSYLSICRN